MDHPPPVPLRIAVVVGEDARADAARIASVVERANTQLGWRYDVRLVLGDGGPPRPDPLTGGREPSWQNPLDWRDADVVIVVLWNTRPRALMAVGPMEVALWGPTDPDLLVLARKGAALVETPQEAYEKAATLEFCQAAGDRAYPYDDALSFETGLFAGLARVARDRWARREGVDRLFCPVCGAESPVANAPAVCVEHNQVLLHMRHRQEGLGHDNLLGLALDGGRLPLHGRIGGGSFGAVYFSKMQPDGQAVAVKVLRRTGRPIEVKRFEREVKLLEQVHHPNVVQVFDHGWERDGPMYAVMEYLPGRTLNDVLHRIDARALVELMVPLLDGLGVLHEKGMVHRDLKPANIMLVDDPQRPDHPPRPVLIDLGLGKHLLHADGSELTQHGMAMGTHNYMAPEQFERAHDVDARADLYSIAVILYRGLTGAPPFDFRGLDPVQQVEAWTERWRELCTQAPPSIERPDVPPALIELVLYGLNKKPEERFQSAAEMRAQLLGALNVWRGLRLESRTPAPVQPPELVPPRPSRSDPASATHPLPARRFAVGWWPLAGAATVLLVGLLALLWANRRRSTPPPPPTIIAVTPDQVPVSVATVRAVPTGERPRAAARITPSVAPELRAPLSAAPPSAAPPSAAPSVAGAPIPEGPPKMARFLSRTSDLAFGPATAPYALILRFLPDPRFATAVAPPDPPKAPATAAAPASVARRDRPRRPRPVRRPATAAPRIERPRRVIPSAAPAAAQADPFELALAEAQELVARKQTRQGVAAYRKAARLKPTAKGPHQALCRLLPGLGESAEALNHCKRWRGMERSPGGIQAADKMIARLQP